MARKSSSERTPDTLRQEILDRVREYYRLVHAPGQSGSFAPGSRVPYAGRVFDADELVTLVEASLEFWLTHGRFASEFERGLAAFLGRRFAFLVNSGSSANLLAFMALTSDLLGARKVARGDEVITVACGFPTTVAPILQYGAVPVFVDVALPTYNIDAGQLAAALSPRTKAVMVAHTLGNPFDLDRVKSFCDQHGLWLIEDNCDALGSIYRSERFPGASPTGLTGTFGDIGTSSFYPPHHLTMGEGGAVYTSDPVLARILASLRDWGRDCWCPSGQDNTCGKRFAQQFGTLPLGYDHKYVYSHQGYNLKATDLQAAVGCAQLRKLPVFTRRRQEHFAFFQDRLASAGEFFILPQATANSQPSWFGFPLTVRRPARFTRNELVGFLEAANIQTRNLFAGNLLRHPSFAALRAGSDYRVIGELPVTDQIMNDTFWFGVYPGMAPGAAEYICQTIFSFLQGRGGPGAGREPAGH